jgi:hypothetical protein
MNIIEKTIHHRGQELIAVCPFPVGDSQLFKIQIRGEDGRATRWLTINAKEFKQIETVLLGETA